MNPTLFLGLFDKPTSITTKQDLDDAIAALMQSDIVQKGSFPTIASGIPFAYVDCYLHVCNEDGSWDRISNGGGGSLPEFDSGSELPDINSHIRLFWSDGAGTVPNGFYVNNSQGSWNLVNGPAIN